jgi:hypothetical protein|tara:strand:+ start:4539 stop:4784 length:246 start_codon:yes stop_codon:yes gene_type:complete
MNFYENVDRLGHTKAKNILDEEWDVTAKKYYLRQMFAHENKKTRHLWTSYEKLSNFEKDFWRASAQKFAQDYPKIKHTKKV